MTKKTGGAFFIGIIGGILVGAIFDNMALGLLLGFAVAFGVISFGRKEKP